jgi:HlyD family secretion protein
MSDNAMQAGGSLPAIRRYMIWGTLFAGGLVISIAIWAFTATISGAVIAGGSLTVLSDVKVIQPPAAGVVTKINVQNGQRVKAGEALIVLDETVAKANLAVAETSLIELEARRSRLIAERDGRSSITFDTPSFESLTPETISDIQSNEIRLFKLRRNTYDGRKAQLDEQIAQLKDQSAGYARQVDANAIQRKFIGQELDSARALWEKQLVTLARVSSLEREAARLDGEQGRLQAAIAELAGKTAELKLAILQVDKELLSEVALELRDVESKILQLEEQRVAAKDQLEKLVLFAPQDGIVHQMKVSTIGGVVAMGDVLMSIVPTADRLVVEAKISPLDIDQVRIGSEARIMFPAFNQRITPELAGTVDYVSADTSQDQKTGAVFYSSRIGVSDEEMSKLRDFSLVPGMPVEVFIKTGDRRVVSILTKPVMDQLNRAFRQD